MKFNDFFSLRDVTINVTNDCCLRCVYCFENKREKMKMTKETMKTILDKCYKNYLKTNDGKFPFVVNFFGGEPLMNWDVIEFAMKYAKEQKYNMSFGATTNLVPLTDHMIDIIEEYELGLLVSIDGVKEIHDRNRCNSYDIVKNNVKRLIDRHLGYLLEARMTLMPQDVNLLLPSIQSIVDMGIVDIAPVPVSDTYWSAEDIRNFESNLKVVWNWLFKIYNDNDNKKNISIKFIEDYLEKVLTLPLVQEQMKVCTAGTKTSCSIGVTGDIMPCHQRHSVANNYNDLVLGNILNDEDIREVKFNDGTIHGAFDCSTCVAKPICKGGCPSENLTVNGNGNQMNAIQCLLTMTMASVALEKQQELLECSNVRSHKLNVVIQNLQLLKIMMDDVMTKNPYSNEYVASLLYFYEKLVDMEDILLPNFRIVFQNVLDGLININMINQYNKDSK